MTSHDAYLSLLREIQQLYLPQRNLAFRPGFGSKKTIVLDRHFDGELADSDLKRLVLETLDETNIFEERRRVERLRQARLSFNAALILLSIGTVIILCGILFLLWNHSTAGICSSAAGVVSNFISAVLFRFNQDANNRLDKIKANVAKIDSFRMCLELLGKVDAPAQDRPTLKVEKKEE